MNRREFGELFRRVVRESWLTTGRLAEEAGISPHTLEVYLNRRAPSASAALKVAEALEARGDNMRVLAAELRRAAREVDEA